MGIGTVIGKIFWSRSPEAITFNYTRYGLGFQWRSRFGLFKLEGGRNDKGDTEVSVSGGTRF